MNRTIYKNLQRWKTSAFRKPLLLIGARQTGKSCILKEFGSKEFEYCLFIDFEEETKITQKINEIILEYGLDADRILEAAGLDGTEKRPENTLIVFDEIQRNPRLFTSLKYIKEKRPDVYVAASGSLMGLALKRGTRAPVGYVNIEQMFPMTFYEFLAAAQEHEALAMLQEGDWKHYHYFSSTLAQRLNEYLTIGGMPGPVDLFCQTRDLQLVRREQYEILSLYEQDFNVHLDDPELTDKIRFVWHTACGLSGERNEKNIFYQKLSGRRAADFYVAVQWLCDCGLLHLCYRSLKPDGLLAANIDLKRQNAFKAYPLDTGLVLAQCGFPITLFLSEMDISAKVVYGKIIERNRSRLCGRSAKKEGAPLVPLLKLDAISYSGKRSDSVDVVYPSMKLTPYRLAYPVSPLT
ncbi:MAG: ATP-binding protein, partial [Desulfovibrio sp.]|nr:ATP-binding protein [Desulfovibrio sp.]